ncbi:MAG TPA: hypothetical protein VEL28_22060 [Candidatus Binatia bacterium]|nr:hypothetical protein [Candidatus Binatia bacterium]
MLAAAALSLIAMPALAGHLYDPRTGSWISLNDPFDLRPLPDLLEVVVRNSELLAVTGFTGGALRESLGVREEVLWLGTRGRVAVAITDERVLAATPDSPRWAEVWLRPSEDHPSQALMGDRVALIVTDQRVIGFEGVSGALVQAEISPRERVVRAVADVNVAVVVTNKRALGLAALRGGFFETDLGVREKLESLSMRASHASVTTQDRLLIFRVTDAVWEPRRLPLR